MLSLGLLRSTASKVAPAAQKLSAPAVLNQTRTFVKYNWVDPLNLESQLTDEEKLVRYVNGSVGGWEAQTILSFEVLSISGSI